MPPIPVATGKIARTVYSSLKEALKSRPNLVPLAEYSGVPRFSKSTISKIDDSVAQVKEIERSIGELLAVTLDGNTPAGAVKLLKEDMASLEKQRAKLLSNISKIRHCWTV